MYASFSQKKIPHFLQKNIFFLENMILVGSWRVELEFRVLAQTSFYTTPPSILIFMTWVLQSRLAFGHSARKLVVGPLALRQTESYSVQPRLHIFGNVQKWKALEMCKQPKKSFIIFCTFLMRGEGALAPQIL